MRFKKSYSIKGVGGILRFEFFSKGERGTIFSNSKKFSGQANCQGEGGEALPKFHTPVGVGGGGKMAKNASADT